MRQGSILAFLKPVESKASVEQVVLDANQFQNSPRDPLQQQATSSKSNHFPLSKTENTGAIAASASPRSRLRDPKAAVDQLYPSQLDQLKAITTTLLPVPYSQKFFNECLNPTAHSILCAVATYDSKPVGWMRCRIEPFPSAENRVLTQIYIQALGVLAPYRGIGLASELLRFIMRSAQSQKQAPASIYAHVWENNEDALEWYAKRGFKRVILQPQYYRRLKPSGAWIVRKDFD